MRTLFTIAALSAAFLFSCCAGKKAVGFEELPSPLQSLVTEHFPGKTVAYATLERENMKKKYAVVLSDGTGIEADADGNWNEIESSHGSDIPLGAIPQQIGSYLSAKHPGVALRKIEKRNRGYEVELAGGLEIKFDNNFTVTEYDH